jgi:CheY-like chemotaxis protein
MKKIGSARPTLEPTHDAAKPTLLYVEDEEENWHITQMRLRDRYHLVRASNDQEACKAARTIGPKLYAVLMDIQLKGSRLDGIQLCRLFKGKLAEEQRKDLPPYALDLPELRAPLFFVTAYGARYQEDELKAAGATWLITKPVDFVRLTLALANVSAKAAFSQLDGQ